jgi:hypothetical protein
MGKIGTHDELVAKGLTNIGLGGGTAPIRV